MATRVPFEPSYVYTKVSYAELRTCCDRFGTLIDKRNALIHAHPITDIDGAQILNYKARSIARYPT